MTFRSRLLSQLDASAVATPDEAALDKLEAYFEILVRWNATINLTSLPLDSPTNDTYDRIFTEPLAAARYFPADAKRWFDLGSGGGSPAIPLKVVTAAVHLTMVESRERKAAFLREAVRILEIDAAVANLRFEDISDLDQQSGRQIDAVTVRAVRPDATMFASASALLRPNGRLLVFQSVPQSGDAGGFRLRETVQLTQSGRSFLAIYSLP